MSFPFHSIYTKLWCTLQLEGSYPPHISHLPLYVLCAATFLPGKKLCLLLPNWSAVCSSYLQICQQNLSCCHTIREELSLLPIGQRFCLPATWRVSCFLPDWAGTLSSEASSSPPDSPPPSHSRTPRPPPPPRSRRWPSGAPWSSPSDLGPSTATPANKYTNKIKVNRNPC